MFIYIYIYIFPIYPSLLSPDGGSYIYIYMYGGGGERERERESERETRIQCVRLSVVLVYCAD